MSCKPVKVKWELNNPSEINWRRRPLLVIKDKNVA